MNKERADAARNESAPEHGRRTGREDPDYTVAVVDRALDLLELLARTAPSSLSLLAGEIGCTRTAAFRLLRTLAARGYVVQERARGLWQLGARVSALRAAAAEQGALAAQAAAHVCTLAEEVNEVAYFSERRGLTLRFTAISAPNPAYPRYVDVGTLGPLHAGVGRFLLAYAPDSVQTQVLSQPLARYTPATLTDARRIAADLPRTRARGWMIVESEIEPGAIGVSVPVHDSSGEVVAALSIIGSRLRMKPPRPRQLLEPLLRCAERLSRDLGWRPVPGEAGPGSR